MLLSIQNLSFFFGARPILEEASMQINAGERIGLVGPNGTGKSTLLRLIMGEYTPDEGAINKPKDVTIGFFNQDLLSFSTDENILQVGMMAFERARQIEKDLAVLTAKLEHNSDDEKLLDDYSHLLHDFEVAGGYEMEHRTAEVLEGLGFTTADLQRPYNEFSGGWRMRVLLARMMLQAPDILMLDEPTNHLDLPSIEWLERYLISYPGAVVIVSHDRYFLDRMVNKTVEVWQRDLISYSGNYSFYEKEKAERVIMQQRAFENQQDYIRQQERFIERFKAKASKAAQAQSAMKRLDKLDKIETPDTSRPTMNINFSVGLQPGKIITTLNKVSKNYGPLRILDNASAEIMRGDKIALIGANGKGKSTLLRIIAGTEGAEGERKEGHNIDPSFYAQHQLESLNIEIDILEELKRSGSGKTEVELRQLLGCFLFSGDDVFKKIKVLSGGEKARVALAKTIAAKANFLLLDEPTNHLDIQSVETLTEALQRYEGTYIFVSHDRYFITEAANKIWEIVDGKIREFSGTYAEYVEWQEMQEARKKAAGTAAAPVPKKAEPKKEAAPKPQVNVEELRRLKKEKEKQQRSFDKLEGEISRLQAEKTTLEHSLADPSAYADKSSFTKLDEQYSMVTSKLDNLNKEYDTLFEALFKLDEQIAVMEG